MLGEAVPGHQILEVAQRARHFQQFRHGEHTALDGAAHHLVHAGHAAEPGATVFQQQAGDGVGLTQGIAHLVGRFARGLLQKQGAGLRADGQRRRPFQDLVQFQCFAIACIHDSPQKGASRPLCSSVHSITE